MQEPPVRRQTHMRIIDLLPNLITMAAIAAGLTAIRFGFNDAFESAVRLILLAAVLDGLDGRVARMTRSPDRIASVPWRRVAATRR